MRIGPVFSEFTKYTRAEAEGKSIKFLDGPRTDIKDVEKLIIAMRETKFTRVQIIHYRRDGLELPCTFYLCPLTSEAGRALYFIGIQCIPGTEDEDFYEDGFLRITDQWIRAEQRVRSEDWSHMHQDSSMGMGYKGGKSE